MTGERRAMLIAQTANGRSGTTDDSAGTAVFLASPAASHITAQTIHVNGGALS
jgi:3-oxoacyl-[acyl-carrier protein] reductase